jgi:hypothetical protein
MSAAPAREREPACLPGMADFEAGAIDAERFDHQAHVHVAWCYLRQFPLAEAITRFTAALRRLTVRLGAEGKYHETISWFFMIVLADRMAADPARDWDAFRSGNGDLFDDAGGLLRRHYSAECLEGARGRFVLPDRAP